MIQVKVFPNQTIPVRPSISYPFMWRSGVSGNVYLRTESEKDILLCDATNSGKINPCVGVVHSTICAADEAWDKRLLNETVELSNTR